jgi:ketosteroid isomerase-like protein
VTNCIQFNTSQNGAVSTESDLRNCFETIPELQNSETQVTSSGDLALAQSEIHAQSGSNVSRSTHVAALRHDACSCSASLEINGVYVGDALGCASHGGEQAATGSYCFIEGGGSCSGAQTSQSHPGLFWTPCEMPNFNKIYPEGCQLRGSASEFTEHWATVMAISIHPLPSDKDQLRSMGEVAPEHAETQASLEAATITRLQEMQQSLQQWSTTLSEQWHEANGGLFLSTTTSTPGLAVFGPAPAPFPAPFPAFAS